MQNDSPERDAVNKLSKDLVAAAKVMGIDEARYLVGAYYTIQDDRMRSANQERALTKLAQPSGLVSWFHENNEVFEAQIRKALDVFSNSHELGKWARRQHGIGPVIAAGLLAHIDFEKTHGISKLWSFAGMNPTAVWEKGQKRPWNATLRVLCWKMGESFIKHGKHPECVYGQLLYQRLEKERKLNAQGKFADQAQAILTKKKIGKDTDAYIWYSGSLKRGVLDNWNEIDTPEKTRRVKETFLVTAGTGIHMLPPAHILARARRYAVKMFLSHYYMKGCEVYGKPIPVPYVIAHKGHEDLVPVPA